MNAYSGDPCGTYSFVEKTSGRSSDGTYTISGLPAGNYFLRAKGSYKYVSEWWAGVRSSKKCSQAQSITVTDGSLLQGKDFQLDLRDTTITPVIRLLMK